MSWNYVKHTGNIYEHHLVAASALGRGLPSGVVVHHVNGNGLDNRPENLVILQSKAEHNILHRRQRALDASGNPDFVKCEYCLQYDDPKSPDVYSRIRPNGALRARHRSCHSMAEAKRKHPILS